MITAAFKIVTNEDWLFNLVLMPTVDLVGATALMQIKPEAGHPDSWLDLSSEEGANDPGISFELDAANKTLIGAIPQATVWDIPPGSYVGDVLVIYADGQRRREASITLQVERGVTDSERADPVTVLAAGDAILEI